MCQGIGAPVTCSMFTGNDWDENSVKTWNQLKADSYTTTITPPNTVSYGNGSSSRSVANADQWYNWNIKSIVKKWADDHSKIDKGLIFRMYNTFLENSTYAANMKTFSSMQGNSSYRPYINIRYKFIGCKGKRTVKDEYMHSVNCHAYAYFFEQNDKGFFSGYFGGIDMLNDLAMCSKEAALLHTKTTLEEWMDDILGEDNWRQIADTTANPAYTAALYDDEWLVCMRVGVNKQNGSPTMFDYHFWYRANNGKWYNKHGSEKPAEASSELNPSTVKNAAGWEYKHSRNFYNSEVIYYAIKES